MTKRPNVDPKVWDLAAYFLLEASETKHPATDDEIWELAGAIQTECEAACRLLDERQDDEVTVDRLCLSVRSINCLRAADAKTVGDVRAMSDSALLCVPGLGRKTLKEIRDVIQLRDWV